MGEEIWFVLQHVAYEGPGAIADAIARHGFGCRVVRIDEGEPVPLVQTFGDMAGLVVMGGPMHIHDEGLAWLHDERNLMEAAVLAGLPVLGVGLGAQQLAAALGGVVASGQAPEVGVGEVHLTPSGRRDPVFGAAGSPLACRHWHGQAFRFGPRAYGLQFHVEVTASLVGHWGPHLPPGVVVRAPDIAHISRAGVGVLERFVALATAEDP